VLPATHAGTAAQRSVVAFQAKAGALQAQLDWPVSELVVSYSSVVPHGRHALSPSSANWPAVQFVHAVSAVLVQTAALPKAQVDEEQLEHGA